MHIKDRLHNLTTQRLPFEEQLRAHLTYASQNTNEHEAGNAHAVSDIWWWSRRREDNVTQLLALFAQNGVNTLFFLGQGEHSLALHDNTYAYTLTRAHYLPNPAIIAESPYTNYFLVPRATLAEFPILANSEEGIPYVLQKTHLMDTKVTPDDRGRLQKALHILGYICNDIDKGGNTCYLKDDNGKPIFYMDENGQRRKMVALLDDNCLRRNNHRPRLTEEGLARLSEEDRTFITNWIVQHPGLGVEGMDAPSPRQPSTGRYP